MSLVGTEVELEVGPVAHGGHCVARYEGRVVFVRHAIPGELVRARVTEGEQDSRFLRADAVSIVAASADRVSPPCPHAGPDACGGCDFQHVALHRQRAMLADVIEEQLRRLAGITRSVTVEAVPGDVDGLGWRTRVRFTGTPERRPGLRKHRSHDTVPIDWCRIAVPDLPDVSGELAAGAESAEAVATSAGDRVVVTDPSYAPIVVELALGRRWKVQAGDFWQVHPGAAEALVSAVLDGLDPQRGERCWDLYSGVGLFSAALAGRVGSAGSVTAVESHRRSVENARANLTDLPQVTLVADRVDRFVRGRHSGGRPDVVVVDPPRAGCGAAVIRAVTGLRPRALAYVACDPAALARDVRTLGECGYRLDTLRAFDIFPMTHHVECVALLGK